LAEDIPDVITCFKFSDDRFRGLSSAEGQILPFPIDFDCRPYNTLTLPCERVISARSLCVTWGLRGRAIEWCQTYSTATNPCCHGNEFWDKIGYNSAYIWDITKIFTYNRGFSGSGYWITPEKFYREEPPLPWQRNLRQNGL